MDISNFREEITHQLTTFNIAEKSKTIPLKAGQTASLPTVFGQGRITQLWITFPGWFWEHWDRTRLTSQSLLKTLILRIYWDGEDVAAVECPVGDFFGNGLCEISNFTSRYFGMSSGGFYCKFPMPFRKSFRIEFENKDERIDTDIFANVLYQITPEVVPDVGYFHTQFRTGKNAGPDPVEIFEITGRGHFVGCVLSAQAEEKHYLSFLEAPEYISIDDDWDVPRIIGTGLEDYFLGGWYFREGIFAGELHGVTSKDALNSSVAMYRAHEDDAIHFQKRLRFQFVNPWNPERLKPFAFSAAAFCYLDSPAGKGPEIPHVTDLLCWYRIRDTDRLSVP
ncbi:MAG: glycoside hydrolase family 172 protein [Chthoniobacterales bacterium]